MTPKEQQLLNFIEDYIEDHGYSPSFDEMRIVLGLAAKSSVARMVESLKAQGRIAEIVPGVSKARNIRISRPGLSDFTDAELLDELKNRRADHA